jgi:hypothetical protein
MYTGRVLARWHGRRQDLDGTIKNGSQNWPTPRYLVRRAQRRLTITPDGFFAGSAWKYRRNGASSEVSAFSVQQFWEHLYRPDLVEQCSRAIRTPL